MIDLIKQSSLGKMLTYFYERRDIIPMLAYLVWYIVTHRRSWTWKTFRHLASEQACVNLLVLVPLHFSSWRKWLFECWVFVSARLGEAESCEKWGWWSNCAPWEGITLWEFVAGVDQWFTQLTASIGTQTKCGKLCSRKGVLLLY